MINTALGLILGALVALALVLLFTQPDPDALGPAGVALVNSYISGVGLLLA